MAYSPNSTPENHALNGHMDDHSDNLSMCEEPHLHDSASFVQCSPENGVSTVDQLSKNPPNARCRSLIHDSTSLDSIDDLIKKKHTDDSLPIGVELYRYLVDGKKDEILDMKVKLWRYKCKEDKKSGLHVAACAGQAQLISDLIPLCKDIIKWKNSKGDLAFHCAAKAAELDALKSLTDWERYDEDAGISSVLLTEGNEQGDTALHIALENNLVEMASFLLKECPPACYKANTKKKSPLYMAIKSGYWELVKKMVGYTKQLKPDSEDALISSQSVVHAAIEAERNDILELILNNHGKLIDSLDDEGQTPLSYAAFRGYLDGVQYLLKKFPHVAYKCDEDGSFPVHKAASGGHVKVIKVLQSTKKLLNNKGQNILHVASTHGKAEVVSYLLKILELERFINLKDEDGNTPLHLASKGFHPRAVFILTREPRTKHNLQNKEGLTALDMAEIHAESPHTFEARLTWMALRYVDAPRSLHSTRKSYLQKINSTGNQNINANSKTELKSYTNRVDTFLLVATLVATVAFAAGFTAPGGYKQDDPNIGMAVLANERAFQVFMICNTAALYSSILSVVSLIWAHLGDIKLIHVSLKFALPLLGFALTMMALAFMMGIFVVLRTLPWLSYVVLGMGSVFSLVVLVLFIPLYNPSYIRNTVVVRFLFSGQFLLMLLVCEKITIKYT